MGLFSKPVLREDIQAARDAIQARGTVGIGRALKVLESQLLDDERVEAMCVVLKPDLGLGVLTSRRVALVVQNPSTRSFTDVWLNTVQSVSYGRAVPQLTQQGVLSVITAGVAGLVLTVNGFADGERMRSLISAAVSRSRQPPSAAPMTPPPPPVPAGWYPDAAGGLRRWWDGSGWTEHTAPLG